MTVSTRFRIKFDAGYARLSRALLISPSDSYVEVAGNDVSVRMPDRSSTRAVGAFPASASPFGALDMAGNVWEWVADGWAPHGAEPATDPSVSGTAALGVIRGGSWDFGPAQLKAFARLKFYAANGHVSTGFRCAKDGDP